MNPAVRTILLLFISNTFMLSAWYAHLKFLGNRVWYVAAFVSWMIACVEYSFHIPANRIGYSVFTLSQLQIIQTGISLMMFIPFSYFVMGTPIKMDYLWASVCLCGASFFIFRGMGL